MSLEKKPEKRLIGYARVSTQQQDLARQTKAFQRPRGVRSGTDLLRLSLAWGSGGYSLQRVDSGFDRHSKTQ